MNNNEEIHKTLSELTTSEIPPMPPKVVTKTFDGDLAGLLQEAVFLVSLFMMMTIEQLRCLALWVAHTHIIRHLDLTPYIDISSPEPGCGKTLLMKLLAYLCPRSWLTGVTSASSIMRKLDQELVTLFFDESDNQFKMDKEMAAMITAMFNVGNERNGKVSVSVPQGKEWVSKDFNVFSAKAFAGIGHLLPQTILDRSILIELLKKKESDGKQRFSREDRLAYQPIFEALAVKFEEWAEMTTCWEKSAQRQYPDLYPKLDDRAFDCWEPLLLIATEAGGEWPKWAEHDAVKLSVNREVKISIGVQLLVDIRAYWQMDTTRVFLSSSQLISHLTNLDTGPWGEYKGKGLTSTGLSSILKRYKTFADGEEKSIVPTRHSDSPQGPQYRGYLVADLQDAWDRYLPKQPVQPVQPVISDTDNGHKPEAGLTGMTTLTGSTGEGSGAKESYAETIARVARQKDMLQ